MQSSVGDLGDRHRQREWQRHVSGCKTSRSRLRPSHRTTTGQMAAGPRLNRGHVDTSLSSRVRRRKSGGSAVAH